MLLVIGFQINLLWDSTFFVPCSLSIFFLLSLYIELILKLNEKRSIKSTKVYCSLLLLQLRSDSLADLEFLKIATAYFTNKLREGFGEKSDSSDLLYLLVRK